MYSKEFLDSLGLDPAIFEPDCEAESSKAPCDQGTVAEYDDIDDILTF